jgi:hypothetical protein
MERDGDFTMDNASSGKPPASRAADPPPPRAVEVIVRGEHVAPGASVTLAVNDPAMREVPVDWEALEDAFENNAPEVHSYLQLATGEVIRVVDGVADPQMHARIAGDPGYLRVDPVSSREQYRWMERFIPMVEDLELRGRLHQAIDGKGAFRRFKDVLMSHAEERERWFTYRSERLRTFMDAWLTAHKITAIARPAWVPTVDDAAQDDPAIDDSLAPPAPSPAPIVSKRRSGDALRRQLRELAEALGPRDLEAVVALAEFFQARRSTRLAKVGEHEHEADGDPPSSRAAPSSESDVG